MSHIDLFGLFGIGIGFFVILLLFLLWNLFWKGSALWIAARKGEFWWFTIILVVNSFGLLEIIYIFAIKKKSFSFETKRFVDRKDNQKSINETVSENTNTESNNQNSQTEQDNSASNS